MITRLSNRINKNKKNVGFTLIELLVVVLIMGILLAVALPLYLSSVKSANKATIQQNMKTIANAAQAYYVKNQSYPATKAAIIGAGKDIENVAGPGTCTYDGAVVSGQYVITVTEGGTDTFDKADGSASTSATYNVTTGVFDGI